MSTNLSAAGDCGKLVPGFMALNMLKRSEELCNTLPSLKNLQGATLVCGRSDYMDEVDRRALCTLFCCCNKNGGRQDCVKQVLWAADGFHGFKGHYKAETPYVDGLPRMSRNEPARPTRGRPGGSRIPDVVVVKDGSKPPTLDNIQKVYEMKFPGDSYDDTKLGKDKMTQKEAYKWLFGDKIDEQEMNVKNCGCGDDEKRRQTSPENASVLERASAWAAKREEAIAIKPLLNDEMWLLAASALGGGAGTLAGSAAAWFQRAAQVLKFAF